LSNGPQLAHFHARRECDYVKLKWEVRNAPPLHWRPPTLLRWLRRDSRRAAGQRPDRGDGGPGEPRARSSIVTTLATTGDI